MNTEEKYMSIALEEAKKAYEKDEVPVGAVIVKNNKIIAKAYNQREHFQDATKHAEIICIQKACRKLKSWRLEGCDIYITLEPCSMCAGAILWTRVNRIIYGAKDEKGGALGSSYNLFEQKNLNHHPQIISGILEDKSSVLLKDFFKQKRN